MASQPRLLPWVLVAAEAIVAITAVVLFGLAYPDRFRSKLWENGGVEGWNSNPKQRIYFYANHREPPEIPLLWSQSLTDSNLAIAILGLVVFIARSILNCISYLPRYVNVLYDLLLFSLWTGSLAGQASGDYTDPKHPSPRPWYLTRGCGAAWEETRGWCRVSQASFGIIVVAACLYGGMLLRQVLQVACQRRRRSVSGWGDGEGQGYESIYVDEEMEMDGSSSLMVEETYDPGLSPVLAFFPSSPRR